MLFVFNYWYERIYSFIILNDLFYVSFLITTNIIENRSIQEIENDVENLRARLSATKEHALVFSLLQKEQKRLRDYKRTLKLASYVKKWFVLLCFAFRWVLSISNPNLNFNIEIVFETKYVCTHTLTHTLNAWLYLIFIIAGVWDFSQSQ